MIYGKLSPSEIIALRYINSDASIEMCWPCRVVEDSSTLLALFIRKGSRYRAGPKRSAAEKRAHPRETYLPPDEYVWRKDTLRLMFPNRCHSISLFIDGETEKSVSRYFVNMEEPFRRSTIGIDTQDHTLDINFTPELLWQWRDEEELENHLYHGFYSKELAKEIRQEGETVIDEIKSGTHPCLEWSKWAPNPEWEPAELPVGWDTEPSTLWDRRLWAYGLT